MTPEEVWKLTLPALQAKLSSDIYSLWAKNLRLLEFREIEEGKAIALVTSSTFFHLTMAEKKIGEELRHALEKITGKSVEVEYTMRRNKDEKLSADEGSADAASTKKKKDQVPDGSPTLFSQIEDGRHPAPIPSGFSLALQRAGLREDYIFETFAVSSSNEMAHAAAVAVSQSPGTAYNPLFLHGGVGVGKTHLMQAIGNNILRKNPDTAIMYITGEQFTNEIVAAIQQKKTIQLKKKMRNYKVLLVDDIQFIAGKETVQEEFFHTFNAILPVGGQIILTSDRPPQEITFLEDRLRSRFEAGLIVDIQQPSFELRTAILLIKAKKLNLPLAMDVAQRIASAIDSTRRLEGILVKLHSEHILFKKPLTIALAEEVLGKIEQVEISRKDIKPNEVLRVVAAQYHITTNSLRGPSRIKELVEARHIAMYIMHKGLGMTLDNIGSVFNGRDHSTVIHASEKMGLLIPQDENLRMKVNAVKTSLSL